MRKQINIFLMPITCTAAGDQLVAQPMKQGTRLQPLQELLHDAATLQLEENMRGVVCVLTPSAHSRR